MKCILAYFYAVPAKCLSVEWLASKEGRLGISIVFADEGERVRVGMNETSGRNKVECVCTVARIGMEQTNGENMKSLFFICC